MIFFHPKIGSGSEINDWSTRNEEEMFPFWEVTTKTTNKEFIDHEDEAGEESSSNRENRALEEELNRKFMCFCVR